MPRLSVEDYQVGWVCALPKEMTAARAMLDEEHEGLSQRIMHDNNSYVLGKIHNHNVVMACLPTGRYGTTSATTVAINMLRTFPNVRFGLMVGIGAGVPDLERGWDIRLGDVVVSQPEGTHGGVVQYDFKKNLGEGIYELKGFLSPPPAVLLAALANLQSRHTMHGNELSSILSDMNRRFPRLAKSGYVHPGVERDLLYCSTTNKDLNSGACPQLLEGIVLRPSRDDDSPEIHYGTIASGNELVKNAVERDRLGREMDAKCIEMEAAGLMNDFPCVVVRGICDYADSHKNDVWQEYAAATAAAFVKELLRLVQPADVIRPTEAGAPIPAVKSSGFELGLNMFDAPDLDRAHFIGRVSEIREMERILHLKPVSADLTREVLILGGMGGVGKTQLAITYAKHYRSFYSSIFWLNVSTEAAILASIRDIANRVMSPEEVGQVEDSQLWSLVSNWLSEVGNTRWLLIFDNYDDPTQYNIKAYYPSATHGSIIVTTRQPRRLEGRQLRIGPMRSTDDGLQILATRSQRNNVHSDSDALKLVKRLDCHPLALATTGAFLKESSVSFGEYLAQYEARWKVIDTIEELPEYPARTLFTTWNLSFELIRREDMRAAQLLKFLAYFDNRDIWYDLLRGTEKYDESPGWYQAVMKDKFTFESEMYVLTKYCLVETNHTTGSYSLHICVHDWILNELNKRTDLSLYRLALDCFSNHVPNFGWDDLVSETYNRFTPHARQLAHDRFITILSVNTLPQWDFWKLDQAAKLLCRKGQYAASGLMLERLLAMQEQVLGPEDEAILVTLNNLGTVYTGMGRYSDAEKMCTRALTSKEKTLGAGHPSTLMALQTLASTYFYQKRDAESEQLYERAMNGFEKLYGPDHSSTLDSVSDLGRLYYEQGKFKEAENMYVRALVGSEKVLGPEHPATLLTLQNIARLYADQNEWNEAEEMYKRAILGLERTLGPEHPYTLYVVGDLACLVRDQGKKDEAEQMFQRVVTGRESSLGPNHPHTLNTLELLNGLRSGVSGT